MPARRIFSLLTIVAAASCVAPAAAQMYPGEDVIVNPAAIPPSHLLAPGQPYPGLGLKPPAPRRPHRRRAPAKTAADTTPAPAQTSGSTTPAVAAVTPPPPADATPSSAHKSKRDAPAAQSGADANAVPFTFGEDQPLGGTPAKSSATPAQPPALAARPSEKTADKSDVLQAGLAKRGAIIFEHSATDPQPSQLDGIKLLAGDLNSALEAGATQIQLQAFGGAPGDKSSDARRISLRRALAIRQLLIDNGVPASRIVTRAMGGIMDNGSPDRVDVYVRAS